MNTLTKTLLGTAAIALACATTVLAQDSADAAPRPGHRSPLIQALDANHDGVLDATEIANASKALASLDANHDGQLTAEEIRPAGGGRGRGKDAAGEGAGRGGPKGGKGPRRGAPAAE